MKRFFLFLFLLGCSLAFAQAQVTLTKETHGFITGKNATVQRVKYQSPGTGGRNANWDFSQVERIDEAVTSVTDFEIEETTGYIRSLRHSDGMTFLYNISNAGNEYVGYDSRNVQVRFTKPLLKTTYPQSFGTYFEGEFEGKYSYSTGSSKPLSGTYSTHADAEGIITLPNGESYTALRVHTTQTTDMGGSKTHIEKYLWYASNVRLPLFVSVRTFSVNKNGDKVLRGEEAYFNPETQKLNDATGIESPVETIAYKVFPNPFQGIVELSYDLPQETAVIVELYDSQGMKLNTLVSQIQSGFVSLSKDVSAFTHSQGTYFLKMQFGDKSYTEKLIRR